MTRLLVAGVVRRDGARYVARVATTTTDTTTTAASFDDALRVALIIATENVSTCAD